MNQTLTRKQFDILSILAEEKGTLSQRQLGEKSGHSLGTVNRVMQELTELQYVTEGEITGAGISALEPFRSLTVQNAPSSLQPDSAAGWCPLPLTPRNHWYVCMDSVLLTD